MDQKLQNKQIDFYEQILKALRLLTVKSTEMQQRKPHIFNEVLKWMKIIVDLKESGQKTQYLQYIQRFQSDESIILWFRNYLNDPKPAIRQNSIKFLRYLIEDKNILIIYRQRGIHYFIARSLERDLRQDKSYQQLSQQQQQQQLQNNQGQQSLQQQNQQNAMQEVLQALKFVHRWLEVNQVKFPKVLGNALVSFAESCGEQMRRYAIITLRMFALNQPDICGWCGGIKLLIEAAVDSQISDLSDQIVWSLLYLLNEPNTRSAIRVYLDFSKWFSLFTEIDPPLDQKQDKQRQQQNRFEQQLQLSKKALISVLKSWQGLIYLGNEQQALKSLVDALRQPIKPVIRSSIYEILKDLLGLGSKENTGVAIAHRFNEAPQRSGSAEFKINNLLNNYLVMLIQLLLDCGLFKVLVELSGLEDVEVAQPAQKFLKDLSGLMFNLIPDYHRYTDFLIAAANQNDPFLVDLKSWSSEIVNTMGNYAFDQEKKVKVQVSKFIYQTENLYQSMQLGLPTHKINNETVTIIRAQIEQEADDNRFQQLIKTSLVIQNKDECSRWHWESIQELLETYLTNNPSRILEALKNKFLKILLSYYFPFNLQFVVKEWRPENFIQAKCGYLLLKLLCKDHKGRELLMTTGEGLLKISKTFFQDLKSLLTCDIQTLIPQIQGRGSLPASSQSFLDNFSPNNAQNIIDLDSKSNLINNSSAYINLNQINQQQPQNQGKKQQIHAALQLLNVDLYQTHMIREYISWISILTSFKKGQAKLIQDGIYQILMQWVDRTGRRDHILVQLIHSFDYEKAGPNREFFQHCLINGTRNIIRACLDYLRLLYRTELHDEGQWIIELLLLSIKSEDDQIAQHTLLVIEEVTQDVENMNRFIEKIGLPRLLFLCQKAQSSFIITVLSHKKGLERVLREQLDFLLKELERWKEEESLLYIDRVEKVMCNALEFVQTDDSTSILYRFPSLFKSQVPENSNIGMQFIYKMPWQMHIEYEQAEIEVQSLLTVSVESIQNNKLVLIGKPYYSSEAAMDQAVISANSQFIIKLHLSVGCVTIDNNCKEPNQTYVVRFDYNDKRHLGQMQGEYLTIEKNGITLTFEFLRQDHQKIRLFSVRVIFRMGDQKHTPHKMPPHLFGELAYTERGFDLLQERQYIDYFINLVRNDKIEPQNKRCALWAIGHIGQSKHGARYIRDNKLIPDLVKIAEQHPVLSLRGTCLYTLNMICTTNTGRKELEKFGWISHLNSNLGWLCIPKNIYQFFYIRQQLKENQRTYWAFQDEIWEKYNFVQKNIRLNADQKKILETIALMSNQLTFKDAEREIAKIKQSKPEQFDNLDLFHSILLMITFYKFKTHAKIKIYQYFDKMFTPIFIQQALENPIYQQIGCQDGTII